MARSLKIGAWVLVVGFISLAGSSCVVQKNPVSGKKRAYGYSWEEEVEIGKDADRQIQQQYGVYQDEELGEYVTGVSEKILSVSHMRREGTLQQYRETEFYFRVLNSPVINAFALPGGYVYVTRGLLAHLENEAQLAVVIGHEIGHVAARHASQRALEQTVGQIALIGGAIAGEELLGVPGQEILNLGGSAARFLFLKYSRDDERESDRLGVEYAAMRHYRAAEGADFFNTLERKSEKSGQDIPSFMSTHPDPEERESTIPELAEQWRNRGYEQTELNRDRYLDHIEGMVYGNNPREGFTRDGTFYHPDLEFKFSYPVNWSVINQASKVVLVSENRDAAIVMGIDSESESARESVLEFIDRDEINVLSTSNAESEGLPDYQATVEVKMRDGSTLGVFVYAVEYRESVYRFVSQAPSDKFSNYRPVFTRISYSFAPLIDRDILNVKPVRLQVVTTEKSGPFKSFLPDDLPMDITPGEVALLNQLHLDDSVEAGTRIKLPVR